jgi:hypothetical protein
MSATTESIWREQRLCLKHDGGALSQVGHLSNLGIARKSSGSVANALKVCVMFSDPLVVENSARTLRLVKLAVNENFLETFLAQALRKL